jgi:hypothetical protein
VGVRLRAHAGEQCKAQFSLKIGQQAADRGLGQEQQIGGGRDRAAFDDGAEGFDLTMGKPHVGLIALAYG